MEFYIKFYQLLKKKSYTRMYYMGALSTKNQLSIRKLIRIRSKFVFGFGSEGYKKSGSDALGELNLITMWRGFGRWS